MWLLGQHEFAPETIDELGPESFLTLFAQEFCTNFAGEVTFPRYYLPKL